MKAFTYQRADSTADAAAAAIKPGAKIIAGGTNLLDLMKLQVETPSVLIEGRRINSCLTLAVMHDGQSVTTIEGLAEGDNLHPLQTAFVEHDGFQCGYCTSGQICSAIGMLAEARSGMPSYVTEDLTKSAAELTDAEIRERMSGNICRCAAYPNIVAAIKQAGGVAT